MAENPEDGSDCVSVAAVETAVLETIPRQELKQRHANYLILLVGVRGFEPPTPASRSLGPAARLLMSGQRSTFSLGCFRYLTNLRMLEKVQ